MQTLDFTYDMAERPMRIVGGPNGVMEYAYDGNLRRSRGVREVSEWTGANPGTQDMNFFLYGRDGALLGTFIVKGHKAEFVDVPYNPYFASDVAGIPGLADAGSLESHFGGALTRGLAGGGDIFADNYRHFDDPKGQGLWAQVIDYVPVNGAPFARIERHNDLVPGDAPGTTRTSPRVITWLHSDHLGSAVMQTKATGTMGCVGWSARFCACGQFDGFLEYRSREVANRWGMRSILPPMLLIQVTVKLQDLRRTKGEHLRVLQLHAKAWAWFEPDMLEALPCWTWSRRTVRERVTVRQGYRRGWRPCHQAQDQLGGIEPLPEARNGLYWPYMCRESVNGLNGKSSGNDRHRRRNCEWIIPYGQTKPCLVRVRAC